MKKAILSIIIGLLIITSAVAILNNKESALSQWANVKAERDLEISNKVSTTIIEREYTTNKICSIDSSKKIECTVCFDYKVVPDEYKQYLRKIFPSTKCIVVSESSTKEEIDKEVSNYIDEEVEKQVTEKYDRTNPMETIEYKDLDLIGKTIGNSIKEK